VTGALTKPKQNGGDAGRAARNVESREKTKDKRGLNKKVDRESERTGRGNRKGGFEMKTSQKERGDFLDDTGGNEVHPSTTPSLFENTRKNAKRT